METDGEDTEIHAQVCMKHLKACLNCEDCIADERTKTERRVAEEVIELLDDLRKSNDLWRLAPDEVANYIEDHFEKYLGKPAKKEGK